MLQQHIRSGFELLATAFLVVICILHSRQSTMQRLKIQLVWISMKMSLIHDGLKTWQLFFFFFLFILLHQLSSCTKCARVHWIVSMQFSPFFSIFKSLKQQYHYKRKKQEKENRNLFIRAIFLVSGYNNRWEAWIFYFIDFLSEGNSFRNSLPR